MLGSCLVLFPGSLREKEERRSFEDGFRREYHRQKDDGDRFNPPRAPKSLKLLKTARAPPVVRGWDSFKTFEVLVLIGFMYP